MLLYIFFSCQNDQLVNNNKKSSTPYICESEETSRHLNTDFEPQLSNWNGHWSHFLLPEKTDLIYTYPHPSGMLLSVHTVYEFIERHKNHSYLYWWGQDCFGEFTSDDVRVCSSESFDQTCLIDSQENYFGHVLFLEHLSDSIESVQYSDTLYQIPEVPVPISRIKARNQVIYYQNRQNIFNANFSPTLPQDNDRYILDFLPTNDGILLSQIEPQLEILKLQYNGTTFEIDQSVPTTRPIHHQQWTIWNDYLISLQKENTIHLSALDSLQTHTEIPLPKEFTQICSNKKVWALSTEGALIGFTIDTTPYAIVEEVRFPLQHEARDYRLNCSSDALYLFDTIQKVLHRTRVE